MSLRWSFCQPTDPSDGHASRVRFLLQYQALPTWTALYLPSVKARRNVISAIPCAFAAAAIGADGTRSLADKTSTAKNAWASSNFDNLFSDLVGAEVRRDRLESARRNNLALLVNHFPPRSSVGSRSRNVEIRKSKALPVILKSPATPVASTH